MEYKIKTIMKSQEDSWKASLIGSIIFFIIVLSMMIEWDVIGGWFK